MSINSIIDTLFQCQSDLIKSPVIEGDKNQLGIIKGKDSILKTLSQLSVVSKRPFVLNSVVFNPPDALSIGASFWRRYGCYLNCGSCCLDYSMDYLPTEWDTFKKLYALEGDDIEMRYFNINGIRHPIYSFSQKDAHIKYDRKRCRFLNLTTGSCRIHRYNAFSCQVELIKFLVYKKRGYISKRPYGRYWVMKRVVDNEQPVLCDFQDFNLDQFNDNDVPTLERMLGWANYFKIDTWLPEIIMLMQDAVKKGDLTKIQIY